MRIPDYRTLMQTARQRLERAQSSRQIILIFALISCGVAAFITGMQFFLDMQIAKTGGLSSMGLRSFLSTMSQFLPVVQMIFLMVLEFGYMAAMVRISRGQYTSTKTLKAGVDRLWPLLRLNVAKMLIYMGVAFASFYIAMGIFLVSPFSHQLIELLKPIAADSAVLSGSVPVLDDAVQAAITRATIPAFVILGIVLLVLFPPTFYRYRMANYVLYDQPALGTFAVMRESHKMMKNNRLLLFRLDLCFWWYYLLMILVAVIAYGDMILSMAGIVLPISENVSFFLFYVISLAIQTAVLFYFRNKVETTYALAYDSIRPKPQQNGVVLGNIFQL